MHEPGVQEFTQHEARAASLLELVHVGTAVGIYAGQQGHDGREFGKVRPADDQPGRAGHRHPVDQVVGGAPRGQQGRHGVDDGAFVHQPADGGEARTAAHQVQHLSHRLPGELFAQAVVRVDVGRAGHVQPHGLQQHLVAVGRAVEGAGARAMVGLAFGGQQGLTSDQPLGRLFAHACLVLVGQTRTHGSGRHEHAGQVSEVKRPDQQPRHDLVAHAQQQGGVEHVVGQGHGRGHGDGVARKQAQLHAGLALRDAVAHGRHATGHLGDGALAPCFVTDTCGIAFVGLVGRQHVVVGRHHADVGRLLRHDAQLVLRRHGGKGMRHVGTAHAIGAADARSQAIQALQVGRAQRLAALTNAFGHRMHHGMDRDRAAHAELRSLQGQAM